MTNFSLFIILWLQYTMQIILQNIESISMLLMLCLISYMHLNLFCNEFFLNLYNISNNSWNLKSAFKICSCNKNLNATEHEITISIFLSDSCISKMKINLFPLSFCYPVFTVAHRPIQEVWQACVSGPRQCRQNHTAECPEGGPHDTACTNTPC